MENNVGLMVDGLVSMVGCDLGPITEADFENEDGLMCCGKCREPKQKRLSLPISGFENRVVRVQCRCEREAWEKEQQQKKKIAEAEAVAQLRKLSLMDEKVKDSTFESFAVTAENARQLKICRRYVEAFDQMQEKNQGMIFWGNPGTGKTFASACIANALLDQQRSVVMTSFVKLIAEVQKFDSSNDEEAIIRRMNRASLLIIDDLGAERSTDFALERVYNIIDSRYRARKPMILTTNLSLRQMQSTQDIRYARIYDRVFEVCYPVEFKGQSWRYVEAAKRYDEMKSLLESE